MNDSYRTRPQATEKMPPGISYIVGNEAAERFSFYGMKAILFVFMTKYLLDAQGQVDPFSDEVATQWIHWFVSLAYFCPLLGALLADVFFGKYKTIITLSLVYCLGHGVLALNDVLPIHQQYGLGLGLALIALGSGGIKPCVSAHVGDQFGQRNRNLLSRVFGWFYFSINFGSFFSTLLTPLLLKHVGPAVAFGIPGALMLMATWLFWLGRHKFVHIPPGGVGFLKESFSGDGRRALLNLIPLYLFVAVFWALYDQTASSWIAEAERMDRTLLGHTVLSSQVQAINPLLILIFIPLFTYAIYPALNAVFPLTPLRKIAIGFFITAGAFAVVALTSQEINGGRVLRATSTLDPEVWYGNQVLVGDDEKRGGWLSSPLTAPLASALTTAATTSPDQVRSPGRDDADHADGDASANAQPAATASHTIGFPQELLIELRENRAWTFDRLAINPAVAIPAPVLQKAAEDAKDSGRSDVDPAASWARDVEVLVGETRSMEPENWTSVARFELAPRDELQEITFEPQTARYVLLRVHANGGGPLAALGRVQVLAAAAQPPAEAHALAGPVWPDVAAVGHRPSIGWQLLAYVLITAAEVMVSITTLEFSYTQAPNKMKSFIMALYMLSVSLGNFFVSLVNKAILDPDGSSRLPGASYFWFFTSLMLAAAVGFVVYSQFYRGQTYIQDDQSIGDPFDHDHAEEPIMGVERSSS